MNTQSKKRAAEKKGAKDKRSDRLRVLIASALPVTAAGLESLLRPHPDLEVIVSSGAEGRIEDLLSLGDVLLIDADEYDSTNGDFFDAVSQWSRVIPVLALVANPSPGWLSRALRAGTRGLLPQAVTADELGDALRASSSGLTVLSHEFSEIIFATSNHAVDDGFEPEPLTPREQEVLAMMGEGLLNKQIADRLKVSEHTVKFHVSSIMGKMGATSRTEAVTRGIRRGLFFV